MATELRLERWSPAGAHRRDARLDDDAPLPDPARPPLDEGRFRRGTLEAPADGTLVLELASPRPLRVWIGAALVLDEPLTWRWFERQVRAAAWVPVGAGPVEVLVEVGPRPVHPAHIDAHCPSRNRERVRAALRERLPDELRLRASFAAGVALPPASLRFLPGQFSRDGLVWQETVLRRFPDLRPAPSTQWRDPADAAAATPFELRSAFDPRAPHDGSTEADRAAGLRRLYVPVGATDRPRPPLREVGRPETRVEPHREVAALLALSVSAAGGAVEVELPVHESLGRASPVAGWRRLAWPPAEEALARLPEPRLPPAWADFGPLYAEAWRMLLRLVREPRPESGLPGSYVMTGSNFPFFQFVWDTSFATMALAYGGRVLPAAATIDLLYTRQFDGGYFHREYDVRDGAPVLYEPDFSPNPPVMSVAEWSLARVSGDLDRVRRVYPALADGHRWLVANRRLPDGTYWTTGLANGLDNSPSLGDGYPDLTAQMAHDAEMLALMADAAGLPDEARAWRAEREETAAALNRRLWSDALQFYSTSLAGGGHNPNKVVTGFWPLWAGIVPPERVAALARHLKDPSSFWRHHPLPSLAADSPHFVAGGNYWLGSTWAPTNFAAIQGFRRAGRLDLARETAERHLRCMAETLAATGRIWENYCSEASRPGSVSMPDYCWSAAGPIALLFEVLLGLEPDAPAGRLRWEPPVGVECGVRRFPLGPATIALCQRADGAVEVESDAPFTLEWVRDGQVAVHACPAGHRSLAP